MGIDIDSVIFTAFLIINLVAGLYFSKGTTNIEEYAIGKRDFSTATIAATIVATWITGEVFFTTLSETYSNGMYFVFAAAGDVVALLVIGFFLAPRTAEFLGKLSIASAMGDLFGQQVRIITALFGCIGTTGVIAVQLKVAGLLFEYCFDIPPAYGIIISGIIITLYSSLGGIKSVTLTDVIQFFTFGTIIPSIAFFILGTLDNSSAIVDTISHNPLFDYKEVFNFSLPKSQNFLFLFLFFATVLAINPAIFQRISMSRNTKQVGESFIIAAVSYALVIISIIWISIVLLSVQPHLDPQNLVKHIIFDYSVIGLKGLTLVGIMAMVMSTADSYINTTSVLFVHDLCKPLGVNITSNELSSSRIVSFITGTLSLILSLSGDNLLDLIIATNAFYLPVVVIPFMLAVVGFRSSGKSVLISMVAGFCTLVIGLILKIDILQSATLGMLVNFIFLFGSHYGLKQPGGWVGIKDDTPLQLLRQERKARIQRLYSAITDFEIVTFFRNNSLRSEGMYCFFGLFCIISIYSTMHTIPRELKLLYPALISFIHTTVLFMATGLLSYPLWLQPWKNSIAGAVFWNISVFYILIFSSFSLVIMNNFAQLQVVAFMINLMVIAALMRWQWALCLIVAGIIFTLQFFKVYLGEENLPMSAGILKLESTYILLLVSGVMMMFLKPKQEHQELTEEQNNHLAVMIKDREEELGKAQGLKHEFLRNLEHEVNAPLVGLTSLAPMVLEDFDRLSLQQMKKYVKSIVDSHERYKTLSDNLLDLSRLDSLKYKLNKVKLDLSNLIKSRLDYCRRLYLGNKELEFATEIDSDVIIECDERYITSLIDNLIINAIKYSKEGKVTLQLRKKDSSTVEFQIIDEGIGIPKAELHGIFGAFVVSSKTRTPSGGRGIGLALCKRIAEVHFGSIRADSDGERGAVFTVELPA